MIAESPLRCIKLRRRYAKIIEHTIHLSDSGFFQLFL
ncbi:Uncharacterised protein [Mycobacteroides abscessus subsp. abscessus]|nr:Uncharacterised protein [Mycobacteroides abscessus subsp. abscessus]